VSEKTTPKVSVLIPTKNRYQLLHDTVESVLRQSVPVEVIIVDDASTDNTTELMRKAFPEDQFPVRIIRHEKSAGPTLCRNEAADLATTGFLFTIDDDCLVPSPNTFEQTLASFDLPRIAAVTIPFINVRQNQKVHFVAPDDKDHYVSFMYFGGMVAFRRSAYQAVGGYRTFYFMHTEEPDLSLRLMQAGYIVRLGTADPIHHLESPVRNQTKLHVLGPRNHILYNWYNTPMPELLTRLPISGGSAYLYTFKIRRPDLGTLGVWRGLTGILHEFAKRKPVSRAVHHLSRQLLLAPGRLSEIESMLPPFKEPKTS
jgi:GT2 family glycosyltransferase